MKRPAGFALIEVLVVVGIIDLLGELLLSALGPPRETVQGILPIYLALGVVPPVFLPLMVVPHLVCWNRSRADARARFRKDAWWLR